VTACSCATSILAMAFVTALSRQSQPPPAPPALPPEAFELTATATAGPNAVGTVTVPMVAQIDKYTPEYARTKMTDALKYNGYPGFLNALREAPIAGSLQIGGEKWTIRWARKQPSATGSVISIVTDKPVAFVGGQAQNAKPKAGYEVGVAQFTVDASGHGTGTMAAAARVKPGGETGVRIDDYAEKPVKLTVTARPRK
jgi:hypothetical protein